MPSAITRSSAFPHPESAAIAGMSVNYIIEQMHAFRDGERKSSSGAVPFEGGRHERRVAKLTPA